jgi:hypothetical protein
MSQCQHCGQLPAMHTDRPNLRGFGERRLKSLLDHLDKSRKYNPDRGLEQVEIDALLNPAAAG